MNSILFPKETTQPQNYYFYTQGFSNEELEIIYKGVALLPFKKAIIGENEENLQVRSSSIKWIPPNENWFWLYEKMIKLITEANDALWHFDLHIITDNIQYTEYYAEKNLLNLI